MNSKRVLVLLFAAILVSLLVTTSYASLQQPLWAWQGLVREPDRWWTIATLLDAYCGFVTFYAWVWFKERHSLARGVWFIAIMLLGNIAMASYVLWQLARLPPNVPASSILTARG